MRARYCERESTIKSISVSDTIEHKIHTFSTAKTDTKTRFEKLIMERLTLAF